LNDEYLKNFSLVTEDNVLNDKIAKAIEEARVLTSLNEHLFHLSHIWGHNQGGFTAVKDLTDKVKGLKQG
jgi:hypothetical protein